MTNALITILLSFSSIAFSQSVCNPHFNTYYPHLFFVAHQPILQKNCTDDLIALSNQMKNNPSFSIKIILSYTNVRTKKLAEKRCQYFFNTMQNYSIDIERFIIEYKKQNIMSDKLLFENL